MKNSKLIFIATCFTILISSCKTSLTKLSTDSFILKKKKEGFTLSSYMSEKEVSDKFQSEINDIFVFDVDFDCNSIADCDILAANEAAIKAAQQIGISIKGASVVQASNQGSQTDAGSRIGNFTASITNVITPNLKLSLKFVKELKESSKKYKVIYVYTIKRSEFKNAFYSNTQELKQIIQNNAKIDEIYNNVYNNLEKNQLK